MHLTQIQINSIKALFEPMTSAELDEVLEVLLEEAFKRDWDNEIKEKQW